VVAILRDRLKWSQLESTAQRFSHEYLGRGFERAAQ
jgi:hypothetical protein